MLASAIKVALKDISPIAIVWLRFTMGIIILGIAVALRKQFALPNKSEWGYFALLGFLGITFHLVADGKPAASSIDRFGRPATFSSSSAHLTGQ
jgi:drug/metabolite transporter (DMT)-like permease